MVTSHASGAPLRRYLVVSNQTLGGPHLGRELKDVVRSGPATFHFVVPCTPPRGTLVWTEGQAIHQAQERLDLTMRFAEHLCPSVTGSLGDIDPALAAAEANEQFGPFDEVIVVTHPPGVSRWLKLDVLSRIRKATHLPVAHVVGDTPRAHDEAVRAFRRFAAEQGIILDSREPVPAGAARG